MKNISKSNRQYYLDNLRSVLVILVVIHHVGQAYGPTGGVWPVMEEGAQISILSKFFSVNAGFFMGLLFLISGYVMPGSLEKYGPMKFLQSKFKKLIIPALIMASVLTAFAGVSGKFNSFTSYINLISEPEGLQQVVGHLWYVYHLLFYSVLYSIYEMTIGKKRTKKGIQEFDFGAVEFHLMIMTIIVVVSTLSFFVRLSYPIDKWVTFFKIIPAELAHLPQYMTLFIVGIICGKSLLLEKIQYREGYIWLAIGIGAIIFRYFSLAPPITDLLRITFGLTHADLIVNIVWESILCAGISIGLLTLFREKYNFTNRFWKFHSDNSYGLYLIHIFPVVGLQFLLYGFHIPTWIKFLGISFLATYFGFFLISVLRKSNPIRRCL